MPLYAIIGIKKLKTAGNIQGVIDHATRQRETLNSNGQKNDVLIEPPALDDLMGELRGLNYRKNAVLCLEILLTASPEFFQGKTEEQIKAWEEKSLEWARATFKNDNIRMCIAHRDEATPHLSILATPITLNAKGEKKLNARAFTGGREKLRALWTKYAQAMKPLGLERGREFSPAKHQDIKAYYQAVNQGAELAAKRRIKASELPAPELFDRVNPREYAADLINRVTAFYRKENGALRSALAAERNQRGKITQQIIKDRQLYNAMKENPAAYKKIQEALAAEARARATDRAKYLALLDAIKQYFRNNIARNSTLRKPERLGALLDFVELKQDIKLSLAQAQQEREGQELARG